jgi:3-isopropylmalate dehydrogenase
MRELTGGIYFGDKGRDGPPDNRGAYDECRYSETEVRRIAIKALPPASSHKVAHLLLVQIK